MTKKTRTRFPMARIKKIMLLDEDVGKISQGTPVAISKALELFFADLVQRASTIAAARETKVITPSHLKYAIYAEEKFDFLKDLCKNIPDLTDDVNKKRGRNKEKTEKQTKKRKVKSGGNEEKEGAKKEEPLENVKTENEPKDENESTANASLPETELKDKDTNEKIEDGHDDSVKA